MTSHSKWRSIALVIAVAAVMSACGDQAMPQSDDVLGENGLSKGNWLSRVKTPNEPQSSVCVPMGGTAAPTIWGGDFAAAACDPISLRQVAAGEWKFRQTCRTGRGEVVATGSVTGDLTKRYRANVRIEPPGGGSPMNVQVEGERVGSCPASRD